MALWGKPSPPLPVPVQQGTLWGSHGSSYQPRCLLTLGSESSPDPGEGRGFVRLEAGPSSECVSLSFSLFTPRHLTELLMPGWC